MPPEIKLKNGELRWWLTDIMLWIEWGLPCRSEFEARKAKESGRPQKN